MSPGLAHLCIGLAIDCRDYLDPEIFERIIHGDLAGRSNAEGADIARQLDELRKSPAVTSLEPAARAGAKIPPRRMLAAR